MNPQGRFREIEERITARWESRGEEADGCWQLSKGLVVEALIVNGKGTVTAD